MADNNSSSGGIGLLGVIIGAAIVLGIGYFMFAGGMPGSKPSTTNITVTAPSTPSAPAAPAAPAAPRQ